MGNTLGKNIKTFRKNKGLTQEELAELLNITPQAVSKWESENGLPDVSMLIPLAQVLGVTTDTLLGYDSLSENETLISRVRETVSGLERSEEGRDQKALKVCEYLSTETTLNPGCFELIKDYAEETANLSMYADPVLENCFPDDTERIEKIYRDAIRKGAYLISHCKDKVLVDKTHFALAWIYIHEKDFEYAREHINVLPCISNGRIREKISMELTFFESGFEKMKGDIKDSSVFLFDLVASMLNTIAQNYGWWEKDKDEAMEICDWCEGIVKAFAVRKDAVNITHYIRVRRSIAFFKLVAAKRAGDTALAEEIYAGFAKQIDGEDLTDEEKKQAMELLNNDISHYSKYC
ncbi:helix-turn-helix domain-containing protein [Butyrivibrio sp. AE2032]|uniref:helix-turn-helix domain-containing protein n=1 Tax=Butyrivibrio sp. AE2032 TaxID=1458463 RepID=UPI0006921452|nr:helix-turn-helix transcriptional regulator [Butyrivibrio sp. AE2032]